MFKFLARGTQEPERDPLQVALDPEHVTPDVGERIIPEPAFIRELKSDKGGPYYLTPDSAQPMPSRMFADLDPDEVTAHAEKLNEELKATGLGPGDVTHGVREMLIGGGPAGRKLLVTLEGNSVDNWPDWLDKPEGLQV